MSTINRPVNIAVGFLAGVLVLAIQTAAFSQQETSEQFVERVKKAIVNEEWGRAHSGIKHALDLSPKSPQANYVAAQLYWRERALSEAITCLRTAIVTQPVYPEAHLLLAKCLKERNNLDQAREQATIALSQGASASEVYCLTAEMDIARNDFDEASVSIDNASRYFLEGSDDPALMRQIEQTRALVHKPQEFARLTVDQTGSDIIRPIQRNAVTPRYTEEARSKRYRERCWLGFLSRLKARSNRHCC